MHSFLPTYLGGAFSPLLDISERNFFPRGGGGGGGGLHVYPVHSPAYAPDIDSLLYKVGNHLVCKF